MQRREKKGINPEARERFIVTAVITASFLVLLVLTAVLAVSLVDAEHLRLENAIERAFSNAVIAVQNESQDPSLIIRDDNVKGFGYYSSEGNPLYVWGNAYQRLPVTSFPEGSSASSYDETTGLMESVRYASDVVVMPQNLFVPGEGVIGFPDIIYVSYQASAFNMRIRLVVIYSVFALIAIVILYCFVLKIFSQNSQYREMIRQQERLVALGGAARTLTHEIKNPLSVIRIEIALLRREIPESLAGDIDILDHETQRLTQLTDRVSDFLRNPLGNPEEIDLNTAIRELLPLFPHEIRLAGSYDRPHMVLFDRTRLRSILENLIKNAIEACDGKAVDVEIEIKSDNRHRFHIYVRDKGIGLHDADRKRIYDPFYTTKIHGSGIGLSISREFIAAAGGTLSLYSGENGGAVAEVMIPSAARRRRELAE